MVVDFGTNRKRVCDFLLVVNSNVGPFFHRFGDMVAYRSKIGSSYTHPSRSRKSSSLGVTPFQFWDEPYISEN